MQREVVGVNPPVERSHDGAGVIRMLEAQGVTQLVDGDQEEVYTCRAGRDTKPRFEEEEEEEQSVTQLRGG